MTAFAREACNAPCVPSSNCAASTTATSTAISSCRTRLRSLEPRMREALTKRFKRGKIECQMRVARRCDGTVPVLDRRPPGSRWQELLRRCDEAGTGGWRHRTRSRCCSFPGSVRRQATDEDRCRRPWRPSHGPGHTRYRPIAPARVRSWRVSGAAPGDRGRSRRACAPSCRPAPAPGGAPAQSHAGLSWR
jgi:hypothetical protein